MKEIVLIGCDVGTSGTKAVLTNPKGDVLAEAHRSYDVITLQSQWAEQWPNVWLQAAAECIAQVGAQCDENTQEVGSICISALYGGTGVLCDADMNAVRPALIWMDRRASEEQALVEKTIGIKRIFDVSCNGTDPYFGYTKLLWVQRNEPELWKKVQMILPVHSYIVYKMTGAVTHDYSSAGNLGGLYNYHTHTWDKEMGRELGLSPDLFPQKLAAPHETAGVLNETFAEKLGLKAGTPICVGVVDCIASMLSAGMVRTGDNAAVLGTSLNWGFLHTNTPKDPNLISMPYCISPKQMNYTYGGASTAGALPRWFFDKVLGNESAEGYRALEQSIQDKKIPAGANGLLALPYFMGERTPIWDENASGAFVGLSLLHEREHLFMAILESSAYALRHIMESMEGMQAASGIVLVGGGAKSSLWQSIFANVTGKPVYTMQKPVEAPLGDAFLAGMNAGVLSDFAQVDTWAEKNEAVPVDEAAKKRYDAYFDVYKDLYVNLKENMRTLKKLAD